MNNLCLDISFFMITEFNRNMAYDFKDIQKQFCLS